MLKFRQFDLDWKSDSIVAGFIQQEKGTKYSDLL